MLLRRGLCVVDHCDQRNPAKYVSGQRGDNVAAYSLGPWDRAR